MWQPSSRSKRIVAAAKANIKLPTRPAQQQADNPAPLPAPEPARVAQRGRRVPKKPRMLCTAELWQQLHGTRHTKRKIADDETYVFIEVTPTNWMRFRITHFEECMSEPSPMWFQGVYDDGDWDTVHLGNVRGCSVNWSEFNY